MKELDLYIQSDKTFETFVEEFNSLFSLNLDIEKKNNRLLCQFYSLDIEIILFNNHGMEDDIGIEFSKYNYCLSLVKINRGGVSKEYDDLYSSFAKYFTQKISSQLNYKCMLVENSQHILMQI